MAVFGVGVIAASRASGRLAARIGRNRLVALGLASRRGRRSPRRRRLGPHSPSWPIGVLLLGLGFMFAHSSLLTTATQFAAKARGTAMSLVAFAFMVGGAIGTALGGRIIEATSYHEFYLIGGVGLAALTLVALVAVPAQAHLEETPLHPSLQVAPAEDLGSDNA